MPASSQHRRFIGLTVIFTLAFSTLMAVLLPQSSKSVSAAERLPKNELNTAPNIHASTILTDAYEGVNGNDTKETAISITSADCAVGGSTISGLDLYKPSSSDVDFFKFQGDGQFYKVTVSPTSGDLKFTVQIISGTASSAFQASDNANQAAVSIQFQSITNVSYYIRIAPSNPADTANKTYSLNLCNSSSASTGPTATPIPVSGQPGGSPDSLDSGAGNDTPSSAFANSYIAVGQTIQNLNFYPRAPKSTSAILGDGDVDWIFFYAKEGHTYRFTTKVTAGIDTQILLFDVGDDIPAALNNEPYTIEGLIAENDDYEQLNRGSQLTFTAARNGKYWIKIWNRDPSPKTQANMTYELVLIEVLPATATPVITPTLTPTLAPTLTPTPLGGVGQPDKYEPNNDFAKASLIAPGQDIKGLSFVPYQPTNLNVTDNDYFRMPVKPNLYYSCETSELAPGVDTNLIIYDQRGGTIGTNDDISGEERSKGNFASKFTWYANYEGYVYVMVSEVRPPRADEASSHTYSLKCVIGQAPNQAGSGAPPAASGPDAPAGSPPSVKPATSGPEKPEAPAPAAPPSAPAPARTAVPTEEPIKTIQALTVRPVQRQTSAVAIPRPATPARNITIDIVIFNDSNRNGTSDAGEQVRGITIWVIDERSGTPITQVETDDSGNARININNDGPVRVNVPLFGYNQVVNDISANVRIGLVNELILPKNLP